MTNSSRAIRGCRIKMSISIVRQANNTDRHMCYWTSQVMNGKKYSRNATSRKCGVAFLSRRSRRIPAAVFLSSSFSLSLDNTDMTNSITIPSACDFHLHLRQDEMMRMVTPKVPEGGVSVAYIMVTFPSNTHNDTL